MEGRENQQRDQEEEKNEVNQQIADIKKEIQQSGIADPIEYLEKELEGLKLDEEQKNLFREMLTDT